MKHSETELSRFVINLTSDRTFVINLIPLKHSMTSDLSDLAQKLHFGDKLDTFEAFVTQVSMFEAFCDSSQYFCDKPDIL